MVGGAEHLKVRMHIPGVLTILLHGIDTQAEEHSAQERFLWL